MVRVYLETYGCSANQAHSEVMLGLLSRAGCEIVGEENADVVILNTCIVKNPTESKMRNRIRELSRKKLVVAGCMAEVEPEVIRDIAPSASLLGPSWCRKVGEAVKKVHDGLRVEYVGERKEEKVRLPRIRKNPYIHISEVSEGCLGNCSYCIVKKAKGSLKSFSPEMIVEDIEKSVSSGCKEVWLTSQDMASYGFDIGSSLPELLERILEIPGRFRVRVGMMNPNTLKRIEDEMVEIYRNEKMYRFLHIPVQSGSDSVLKRMRRGYTADEFLQMVDRFRESIPDISIWTDIIVGFPGESDEDFEMTIDLMKRIEPEHTNVSRFGARPGTDAAKMKGLPSDVIRERSRVISELVREIRNRKLKGLIGEERTVLFTDMRNGFSLGRDESYRPVMVRDSLKGEFLRVRITDTKGGVLIGEVQRKNGKK